MSTAGSDSQHEITAELLDEIAGAFNRHDVEGVLSYFDDDGEFLLARGPDSTGRVLRGKPEIRAFLEQRFAAVGDMRWNPIVHWACGDRGVSEWTVSWTQADGARVELLGCDIYRFRGGKIVRKDTYWKSHEAVV